MAKFKAAYHFPKGFLWGTATSSHQVEGNNNNNNWSAWEKIPGKIVEDQKAGLACDWWGGRWKEDFDRAVETGQNAHRLSIEWSRIQPAADRWDEDALDYYRQMIRGLVDRNMTPFVTLHHFTNPIWIEEDGGWLNPQTVVHFEKYVRKVVEALKEYVNLWVTINEPNVYTYFAYLYGDFPPGKSSIPDAWKVAVNIMEGHAAAYHAIHEIQKEARVGMAINYRQFIPAHSWNPLDRLMTSIQHNGFNNCFAVGAQTGDLRMLTYHKKISMAKNTQDYIGINYYCRDYVAFAMDPSRTFSRNFFSPQDELSGTGFIANTPEGLYEGLKWSLQFKVPIIVSENGVEDAADKMRPRYTIQHIHQVWRAVNFNWPVKGYFHWSLVDNFEWERGWTQRFGLWGLDVKTQRRIRNKSVDVYEGICKENGITSELVEKYTPEIFEKIFHA